LINNFSSPIPKYEFVIAKIGQYNLFRFQNFNFWYDEIGSSIVIVSKKKNTKKKIRNTKFVIAKIGQ
jgi:hypothetical protein